MKILSKKKWNDLQDLVVGLQQDLNYTKEQLELSKNQVEYLADELRRERKIRIEMQGILPPKRGRKKKENKEDGTKRKDV